MMSMSGGMMDVLYTRAKQIWLEVPKLFNQAGVLYQREGAMKFQVKFEVTLFNSRELTKYKYTSPFVLLL
jgi:hypothetical protein